MLASFHALGNDPLLQGFCHVNQRGGDCGIVSCDGLPVADLAHKRPIDLERVDRGPGPDSSRWNSRCRSHRGSAHSEFARALAAWRWRTRPDSMRTFSVRSNSRKRGSRPVSCRTVRTLAGKSSARKLHRGKVDRHGDGRQALIEPCPELGAGLAQDPLADGHDQAALFGDGHELRGWNEPSVRAKPADQRFDAVNLSRLQIDFGLVVQHELAPLEGAAQGNLRGIAARRHGSSGPLGRTENCCGHCPWRCTWR